jgi:hypothetical protein
MATGVGGLMNMRGFLLKAGVVVLFAVGADFTTAQSLPQPPPKIAQQSPAAGVDVIMAYAGTWKVQGERFATAHSDAGKEDTTLRNDCWKSGAYVACNQYVNGDSKIMLVFIYNDKEKMYTSYQVPQTGEPAGSGRLQIIGNIWTFPWQITQNGSTTYFHVVNVFTGTDHIDYQQEFSQDNVHWTAMAKGSETKIGN